MNYLQIIAILASILAVANASTCVSPTNLPQFNPATYCGDQVTWNVSTETVNNAHLYHARNLLSPVFVSEAPL